MNFITEINGSASINLPSMQINAPYGTFTTIANQTSTSAVPKLELIVTGISICTQDPGDLAATHLVEIWSVVDGHCGNSPIFIGSGQEGDGPVKWNTNLKLPIQQILWLKFSRSFSTATSFVGDFYICFLDIIAFFTSNPVGEIVTYCHPSNLKMSIILDEDTLHTILSKVIHGASLLGILSKTKELVTLLDQMSPSQTNVNLLNQTEKGIYSNELYSKEVLNLLAHVNSVYFTLCEIQKVEIEHCVFESLFSVSHFLENILSRLLSHSKLVIQDQVQDDFHNASVYATWMKNILELKRELEVQTQNKLKEHQDCLDRLQHAPGRFESECLPGTRAVILSDLVQWAENGTAAMLWLSGGAGTGKTTIAATFAKRLLKAQLAGYHTCRRSSQTLESAILLVQNLCYQLAKVYQPFGVKAAQAIIADKLFSTNEYTIKDLFKILFHDPIRCLDHRIKPAVDLIFVIDALDECGSKQSRVDILIGLHHLQLSCTWIKVFFTSRPNAEISTFVEENGVMRQDLTPEQSTSDVKLFVEHRLGHISEISTKIPKLIQYTSGLFIWAQLACNYILEKFDKLLAVSQIFDGHPSQEAPVNLYHLYGIVLNDVIGSDPDNIQVYTRVMSAILLVAEAIDEQTILELTSTRAFEKHVLKQVIDRLKPILFQGQDGKYYVLHPSFRDYALRADYSKEFHITTENHMMLLDGAVNVMMRNLSFNICELETSYKLNVEVFNLSERIQTKISSALKYSAIHWSYHILHSASLDELHNTDLGKLWRSVKVLYWIEVLSFLNHVRKAILDVTQVQSLLLARLSNSGQKEQDRALYDELEDTCLFLSMFGYCISQSTPHLYVSALPMAPEKSKIARNWTIFRNRVEVLNHKEKTWSDKRNQVLTGHTSKVKSVVVTTDGSIASGAYDYDVRMWDVQTGQQLGHPLKGHTNWVTAISASPNGKYIASGSFDKTIRIWDAQTGQQVGQVLQSHKGCVTSVSFSPTGRHIASGSADEIIRIWDPQTCLQIGEALQGHAGLITSISWSPDGRYIVSGSWDTTGRIWDAKAGQQLQVLQGHTDWINSVSFSSNGRHIASGSFDKTIRIWDAYTGQPVGQVLIAHTSAVSSISFSPDGRYIVSGSWDKTLKIWNTQTGEQVGDSLRGHTDCVNSVAFSPDGRDIVSGSDDNTVRTWNAQIGQQSLQSDRHSIIHVTLFRDGKYKIESASDLSFTILCDLRSALQSGAPPISMILSPDNRHIVSGSYDKTICITDVNSHQEKTLLQGHTDGVNSVSYSPNGTCIVSGGDDQTIRIWSAETGQPLSLLLRPHASPISSVSFSPDGEYVVSGSWDETLRIWNAQTGQQVGQSLQGHTSEVKSLSFSPSGIHIVSGSLDHTVRIWDTQTGKQVGQPLWGHTSGVLSVSFSSDGRHIVSGSNDHTLRVWNAQTSQQVGQPFKGHTDGVQSVSFSLDGHYIASGSSDKTIRIWSTQTGQQVEQPLQGHTGSVRSVSFSPNGYFIASGSDDQMVRLWDAQNGQQVGQLLQGHTKAVTSVSFSSDGKHIVSGSIDCTIRIWTIQSSLPVHHSTYDSQTVAPIAPSKLFIPFLNHHPSVSFIQDGWYQEDGHKILWIPPLYRFNALSSEVLCIPPLSEKQTLFLNWSAFVQGDQWSHIQA
ncbi:WD40 repeat-like protein [Pluteus cervinus]|uniref:WD40 repeat-like protein n=1 Tax=Pluteus cervinus TaxID=181527 RepID=A0ACD3AC37_9AGAR|nr:WD40 repeat-like protein [Pluteus cervinus]